MSQRRALAKALYDNVAEAPDELPFRKGDILTVVEQNTGGIDGWWLCSLRGRNGIVPGNRLKLLAGMYENPYELKKNAANTANSAPAPPHKVVVPKRVGQVYIYESPKQLRQTLGETPQDDYDVPRPTKHLPPQDDSTYDTPTGGGPHHPDDEVYDTPSGRPLSSQFRDAYDTPVPYRHPKDIYDMPSPARPPPLPSTPRGSAVNRGPATAATDREPSELYDTPVKRPLPAKLNNSDQYDAPQGMSIYDTPPKAAAGLADPRDIYDVPTRDSGVSVDRLPGDEDGTYSDYDVPPQVTRDFSEGGIGRRLQDLTLSSEYSELGLEAGLELLANLQKRVDSSVAHLLSYVSSSWRRRSMLDTHIQQIKMAATQVKLSLKGLIDFSNTAAASLQDASLQLSSMLGGLRQVHATLLDSGAALDRQGWDVAQLCLSPQLTYPDSLDRFVLAARGLPEETARVSGLVRSRAHLIFRQGGSAPPAARNPSAARRPLPQVPPSPPGRPADPREGFVDYDEIGEQTPRSVLDDYDYVHLEAGEAANRQRQQLAMLGLQQHRQTLAAGLAPDQLPPTALTPPDRQLLAFYAKQCEANMAGLNTAIDRLFASVDRSAQPRVLVAGGKGLVVAAHQLVFVGDALHRNLDDGRVRLKVSHATDYLCDCIKGAVAATKTAALQHPSINALQAMVHRVTDVSHAAHQLKLIVTNTSAL